MVEIYQSELKSCSGCCKISPLLRFINLPEKDIKVTFIFFRSDMKLIFSLRILSFLLLGSSLKRSLSFKKTAVIKFYVFAGKVVCTLVQQLTNDLNFKGSNTVGSYPPG